MAAAAMTPEEAKALFEARGWDRVELSPMVWVPSGDDSELGSYWGIDMRPGADPDAYGLILETGKGSTSGPWRCFRYLTIPLVPAEVLEWYSSRAWEQYKEAKAAL